MLKLNTSAKPPVLSHGWAVARASLGSWHHGHRRHLLLRSSTEIKVLKLIFVVDVIQGVLASRGLMRGMATLPQGNQELLVVIDKVGRPPGELGVSKSMECGILPSVL